MTSPGSSCVVWVSGWASVSSSRELVRLTERIDGVCFPAFALGEDGVDIAVLITHDDATTEEGKQTLVREMTTRCIFSLFLVTLAYSAHRCPYDSVTRSLNFSSRAKISILCCEFSVLSSRIVLQIQLASVAYHAANRTPGYSHAGNRIQTTRQELHFPQSPLVLFHSFRFFDRRFCTRRTAEDDCVNGSGRNCQLRKKRNSRGKDGSRAGKVHWARPRRHVVPRDRDELHHHEKGSHLRRRRWLLLRLVFLSPQLHLVGGHDPQSVTAHHRIIPHQLTLQTTQ